MKVLASPESNSLVVTDTLLYATARRYAPITSPIIINRVAELARLHAFQIETRKLLMGHANGDITTHYSAAELGELLAAAEKVTDRGIAQTPELTPIRRHAQGVRSEERMRKRGMALLLTAYPGLVTITTPPM